MRATYSFQCLRTASLRFQSSGFYELLPARNLIVDVAGKFIRRTAYGEAAIFGEALTDVGLGPRTREDIGKLRDNPAWRAARSSPPLPGRDIESGNCRFRNRRQIGQRAAALQARYSKRTQSS